MNFQNVPPPPSAPAMLDAAFALARTKVQQKLNKGTWEEQIRKKESRKWDVVIGFLQEKLQKISDSFPVPEQLPEFYQKLLRLTLDEAQYRRSRAQIRGAGQRLVLLQRLYQRRLHLAKGISEARHLSQQFYGRVSSVIQRLEDALHTLHQCRKIMRTYPDVKEISTICIYGFPNVGKTTLLNKLTGTRAKVAAYAFTTTSINVGYMGDQKIQVIDVPGTLARPEKMNFIEKQAELVATDLARVIVYVLDPTETSGYGLSEQFALLRRLRRSDKPLLIYLSKQDLPASETRPLPHFPEEVFTSVPSLKAYLFAQEKIRKRVKL